MRYPFIWTLYFIAFLLIAHCFDSTDYSVSVSSTNLSRLAAVFGFASFNPPSCSGSCSTSRPARVVPNHSSPLPSSLCDSPSINPDLQAGCGFSIGSTPSSSPAPSAAISFAPTEELNDPAGNDLVTTPNPPDPHLVAQSQQ